MEKLGKIIEKLGRIMGIQLQNLLGGSSFKGVQKSSQGDKLQMNSACVGILA